MRLTTNILMIIYFKLTYLKGNSSSSWLFHFETKANTIIHNNNNDTVDFSQFSLQVQ